MMGFVSSLALLRSVTFPKHIEVEWNGTGQVLNVTAIALDIPLQFC